MLNGRNTSRAARLLAAVVVALALLGAGSASAASTAWMSGTTLNIAGGPEADNITFGGSSMLQEYVEDDAGIVAGPGCSQLKPGEVDCIGYTQIEAHLGGGNDTFLAGLVHGVPMTVFGDEGNDTIYGGELADTIDGGPGNDDLDGNGGRDDVQGGVGDDTITAGGDARITGGPGRDSLNGGAHDVLAGGNSEIHAEDGEVDQVSCGLVGTSIVYADRIDVVDPSCTQVHRVGPQAARMLTFRTAPTHMSIAKLLRSGYRFTCTASAPGTMGAALYLSASQARKLHLGTKSVRIAYLARQVTAAGYSVTLKVKPAYQKALRRTRRFSATLILVGIHSNGRPAGSITRVLTFTR